MTKILVTGAAGFIGSTLIKQLIRSGGYDIVGIDNINDYYDVRLKYGRLKEIGINESEISNDTLCSGSITPGFRFIRMDLQQREQLFELMEKERFDIICHLAAQAGVRYSIDHPFAYVESNLVGFMNILEAARQFKINHFIYASSSSVYGLSNNVPYSEAAQVDKPISLYAATKKSNELMAHSYSKLYNLPTTGIRFFTVYGPWGRPDMAPYLFMDAIMTSKPIKVFNHGNLERDFTFIDDIVNGVIKVIEQSAPANEVPYQILNLGNSSPVRLMDFITTMEEITGREAIKEYTDMQQGDVYQTYADMQLFSGTYGYKPEVDIREGLRRMYEWYKSYKQL